MSDATRMILGLVIGITVMIVLVMKTKVHTFIALLMAAAITGLIGGMPITDQTLADGTTVTGLIGMLNVSPLLMAVSCCVGAISFSYFNDSGFWVFNGMFGLTELKDQVRCKTAVSLIMAGVGIVELFILGIFIK